MKSQESDQSAAGWKRVEYGTALALTGLILLLHGIHLARAGGLWRDEAAAVQLARLPSIAEVVHNFPHEAFPLLFPMLLRGYTSAAGASDAALRVFGFAAG